MMRWTATAVLAFVVAACGEATRFYGGPAREPPTVATLQYSSKIFRLDINGRRAPGRWLELLPGSYHLEVAAYGHQSAGDARLRFEVICAGEFSFLPGDSYRLASRLRKEPAQVFARNYAGPGTAVTIIVEIVEKSTGDAISLLECQNTVYRGMTIL